MLSEFRTRVRETCSRRGVRIAKWLGDGAMLVSVEPNPLLAAVLELQRTTDGLQEAAHRVSVRSGVTTGPVILLEGDDYIGHAVNVAARLCDQAPGGAVLAEPVVVANLPKWGCVLATERLVLKGIDEPLEVVQLGSTPPPPGAPTDPVCGLAIWPEVAEATETDGLGRPVLFCSESCHDSWLTRPGPVADELGSVRTPLIGT